MSPLLTPMLQPLKCCHTGNPAPLPYNLSEPSILIEEGTSTCIVQVHSGEWRALESTVSKQMQALCREDTQTDALTELQPLNLLFCPGY